MIKKRVAILFGGCSSEYEVSLKSAYSVILSINNDRYETVLLGITREVHGIVEQVNGVVKITRIDIAFPILHGKNGEDGTVQGLIELAGIPIVGCGALSSAYVWIRIRLINLWL